MDFFPRDLQKKLCKSKASKNHVHIKFNRRSSCTVYVYVEHKHGRSKAMSGSKFNFKKLSRVKRGVFLFCFLFYKHPYGSILFERISTAVQNQNPLAWDVSKFDSALNWDIISTFVNIKQFHLMIRDYKKKNKTQIWRIFTAKTVLFLIFFFRPCIGSWEMKRETCWMWNVIWDFIVYIMTCSKV